MTVMLGLLSALCWGLTDLLARFSGQQIGPYRAMLLAQLPGFLFTSLWFAVDRPALHHAFSATAAGWGAAEGALGAALILLATFSLFRALAVGTLAIVSPVAASYGAITALLSGLGGEAIGGGAATGIAATVVGVALASSPGASSDKRRGLRGVGWAVLAALGYGFGSWVQGAFAVPALGYRATVWIYYAMGCAGLVLLAAPLRESLAPPPLRPLALGLLTGSLSVIAYVAFSAGLGLGEVAVVTVLSSLSSGVAAVLGRAVLGERLAFHQWVGVAAILLGIALINVAR